jgi:S1-C subfamily serine protease
MRYSLLALIVSFLITCFFACSCASSLTRIKASKHRPASVISDMYESTTSVFIEKDAKRKIVGSGVVLYCKQGEPRVVLTAWHVVDAATKVYPIKEEKKGDEDEDKPYTGPRKEIIFTGTQSRDYYVPTKLAKKIEETDLAVLVGVKNEEKDCAFSTVAAELPAVGSTVWVMGNPMGRERNVTRGILSNVFVDDGVTFYRTDAAAFFGNSGGPMFTENGELIGIMDTITVLGSFVPIPVPGGANAVALPHIYEILSGYPHLLP